MVDVEYKGNVEHGIVSIGRHSIIGAGSVILPNIIVNDGATVGALSLVNKDLDEWGLYVGVPVKKIKIRDKRKIIELEYQFFNRNK